MRARLRSLTNSDLTLTIKTEARATRSTDHGHHIAAVVVSALRAVNIILPGCRVIERPAIASRLRTRRRATDALLAGTSETQTVELERLLTFDPTLNMTPFAWMKAIPVAPKADRIREPLERRPRKIGTPAMELLYTPRVGR